MSLLPGLALAAGAALAGSWTFDGDWTEAERAQVERLARSAPEIPYDLVVHRAPAPPLADDLTTPHQLVTRRGGQLTLSVEDLEGRAEDWIQTHLPAADLGAEDLARALLSRQLAHALGHLLDTTHRWSGAPRWRALSGWREGWTGARRPPAEQDALSYANPHGARSPQEDLATLVEYSLVEAPLPGDPALHPRCRLRSKWRWVQERLERPVEDAGCASLAEVGLDPEQVRAIEIVYAEASSRHPASLGGHLMLGVVLDTPRGERVDVYQLGAVTGGMRESNPLYILKGLTGGFSSMVLRSGLARVVRHYEGEDRAIRRYRLLLDPTQKRRLLERLDETRQGWDRPYLFFTRNCMHYPEELVEAALDLSLGLPRVHGPDVFLSRLARLGVLEAVPREALATYPRTDRAEVAEALRRERLRALVDAVPSARDAARDLGSPRPGRRAEAYAGLAALAPTLSEDHAQTLLEVLILSEQLELALQPREEMPERAALWSATAAALARLPAAEVDPASLLRPELEAASPQLPLADAHSPMGRLTLLGSLDAARGAQTPGMSLSWSWYRFRLGEPRAFRGPPGLGFTLLSAQLGLSDLAGAPRPTGALSLIELQRVWGHRPGGNPGAFFTGGQLLLPADPTQTLLTPAALGLSLELLQADAHRHHLLLSAGLTSGLRPLDPTRGAELDGLLRLQGQLGSATHPLTWLGLSAELQAAPWAEARAPQLTGRLSGQLHLVELRGVDSALSVGGAASPSPDGAAFRAELGLALERR